MAKLTSQQANELANYFLGLAQAIGDYRFDNWSTLTKAENQKLGSLQWSILNYGEDILVLSTTLVMDEVETSLAEMQAVTQDIKKTIHKLKSIQKAFDLASSIITLGGAILSKNPDAIGSEIKSLAKTWKE